MDAHKTMEDICLKQDNGCDFRFRGRLFSECSWYDEAAGLLTRQKLYHIVRSGGQTRSRHAYRLFMREDTCVIHNGTTEIALQFDMLMLAVRGLCGLADSATPSLAMVEEMLKAANS